MSGIILVILGIVLFVFPLITPLPTMLMIPSAVWRIIIALFGILLVILGIRKRRNRRK